MSIYLSTYLSIYLYTYYTLRVQVPKYRVYSQNHNYDSYYRNHTYPIFGYFMVPFRVPKILGAAISYGPKKGP